MKETWSYTRPHPVLNPAFDEELAFDVEELSRPTFLLAINLLTNDKQQSLQSKL